MRIAVALALVLPLVGACELIGGLGDLHDRTADSGEAEGDATGGADAPADSGDATLGNDGQSSEDGSRDVRADTHAMPDGPAGDTGASDGPADHALDAASDATEGDADASDAPTNEDAGADVSTDATADASEAGPTVCTFDNTASTFGACTFGP